MIPTYRFSVSSPMPFDVNNEDHNHHHHLFNTNHQASSSSSSLSFSILFNQNQDHGGSYSWELKHKQSDVEVEKFVPSSGSCDHQENEKDENILKKEDGNENFEGENSTSMKLLPSKKRMIQRMMEDQKIEKEKICLGSDNMTVRVCTDCHTTKTPLWRSGPTGPKSLCNACGIRQRKARRALAEAAASANGETLIAADKPYVKGTKLQIKRKRSKTECTAEMKMKGKIGRKSSRDTNKCSSNFEDLITSLSKNLAPHKVFPQDEKEAAILLMALSSGLLHGFPSHGYLDL